MKLGRLADPLSKSYSSSDKNRRVISRLSANRELTYELCGLQLRAPRVAVVFEAGSNWQFWARDAMRQVTSRWAGAGFVLAPYSDDRISRDIVGAIQAYDPDFVVLARQPWRLREGIEPGAIAETFGAGTSAETVIRFADADHADVLPAAVAARRHLAEHCSPYVRQDDGWDESQNLLDGGDHGQIPTAMRAGCVPAVCLAVPESWGGSVATAAASVLGVINESRVDATTTPDDAAVLARILGAPHGALPNALVHSPNGLSLGVDIPQQRTALELTALGLTISWMHGDNRTQRWVVGSTADDYALSVILDRTHGKTRWIDPSWTVDPTSDVASVVRLAALEVSARMDHLLISSASLDADALTKWAKSLDAEVEVAASPGVLIGRSSLGKLRPGPPIYGYTVTGQHDRRQTLPLLRLDDGTIELAAPAPLPTVEPKHPLNLSVVPVQVDITVPDSQMPPGRGFDPHRLASDDPERYHTWIRPARSGITYQSMKYGELVVSGATEYGILATPRLVIPGLGPWMTHMAGQAGYDLKASDAGRKTDVLAQLWGSRDSLTKAIGSPLRTALAMFTPPNQSKDSYLDGEAIRITRDRGVLTFSGIRSFWPAETVEIDVRQTVDDLADRRILRRGLLLRCPECYRLDFFSLEQLAQIVDCDLCGSPIRLVQSSWNLPRDEPRWFYDCHPAARSLVTTNGDVPLLLADHLRQSARSIAHVGEVELVRERKAAAETDLVAFTDGVLSVAEAKINTDLAAGGKLEKAIEKRVLAAKTFRADEIILATTKAAWPDNTVNKLQDSVDKAQWFGRSPSIRLITGLRSDTIGDVSIKA